MKSNKRFIKRIIWPMLLLIISLLVYLYIEYNALFDPVFRLIHQISPNSTSCPYYGELLLPRPTSFKP